MSKSKPQSYESHAQFTPLYHYILAPISLLMFVGAVIYLFRERFSFLAILAFAISLCIMLLVGVVRQFATRLQDRSILHEENFRHFRLTGKPLDSRLTLPQIIALRFAGEEEFLQLCKKAAETGMESKEIKKSIKQWRADHYRV
ncbi:DUF6526 family protein [Paenibacillus hodogayensis]|uniref:DUF6526 family protein n=1 Tax=Paenibacillus hodogayensis TaxID=279208 RepID=A0ABV5W4V8_9BACL